jgi:hypothetical protein
MSIFFFFLELLVLKMNEVRAVSDQAPKLQDSKNFSCTSCPLENMQHPHITSTSGYPSISLTFWVHLTEYMPNMTNTSASGPNLSRHK